MLRVLILCFLLVGCVKNDSEKINHAKKQAANFCSCLNTTIKVVQTGQYMWSVYCEDGLKAENVIYGEEFSCK